MKLLKPSMRERKRYLKLKGQFTRQEVEEAIIRYIGILGYSRASPMWISKGVLAINRESLEDVRASLALVEGVEVEKVSGTLKGLRGKVSRKSK